MSFCSHILGASKLMLTALSRTIVRSYSLTAPQSGLLQNTTTNPGNPWSFNSCRTIIRNNFPRPRYSKLKRKHGWKARMSYKNGRDIIRRKMLKLRWEIAYA